MTHDFGMFTEEGNDVIYQLCINAQKYYYDWRQVLKRLQHLAEHPRFGEATDTVVRERVYDYLEFHKSGERFYI
jgi:hypothetical protein